MITNYILLYDPLETEAVKREVIPLLEGGLQEAVPFVSDSAVDFGLNHVPAESLIITYLSDDQLRDFISLAIEKDWQIGLLPHPNMFHLRKGFGISASIQEAVQNILSAKAPQKIDMLLVNGRPNFDTMVVGECLSTIWGSTEPSRVKRVLGRIANFFRLFKRISLSEYTLIFDEKKKQDINTAALGILVVQHGKSSLLSRKILENTFANDGMMNMLILAPESILGLVKFGILSLFRSQNNPKLPPFAAYIKTDRVVIKSPKPIEFSLDDVLQSAKEIELKVVPKKLLLVPGIHLPTKVQGSNNEVFKTHVLPRGQLKEELLLGPLPLIPHATSEQFKDLFTVLRENSRPRSSYLMLMFLSTLIATLGLFGNSSPVIIGAMILAPLMSPIISLSMGVLRQEKKLIINSLKSIGLGLLLGYLCSILITWILPDLTSNIQILNRTKPNLLDLGIAIASGIAGAYAHAKKEIAQTLAGVAIAVALVPPLAVSGIGIGWMNWPVFSGALLLLMTNLVGIVLAAAITFLFLGYSPFRLAKKGLLVTLVLVIGIVIPLAFSFTRMLRETRIVESLNGHQIDEMVIRNVRVRRMQPLSLSVSVYAPKPLTEPELQKIKKVIDQRFGQQVDLEITTGVRLSN